MAAKDVVVVNCKLPLSLAKTTNECKTYGNIADSIKCIHIMYNNRTKRKSLKPRGDKGGYVLKFIDVIIVCIVDFKTIEIKIPQYKNSLNCQVDLICKA